MLHVSPIVSPSHTEVYYAGLIHSVLKPLNTQLNPICDLLALLEAHHILHVSRIRVNIESAYSARAFGIEFFISNNRYIDCLSLTSAINKSKKLKLHCIYTTLKRKKINKRKHFQSKYKIPHDKQ
jgi:hypothetical protein